MGLGSASEYDPRQTAVEQHPLLRFFDPSTHLATGSDLHRVCLARLRYAFRLSQPPGVLFLPWPSGFVSRRWRPWASPFRGLLLSRSQQDLSVRLPLLALSRPDGPNRDAPFRRWSPTGGPGWSPVSAVPDVSWRPVHIGPDGIGSRDAARLARPEGPTWPAALEIRTRGPERSPLPPPLSPKPQGPGPCAEV
jgi:hypothetical protein